MTQDPEALVRRLFNFWCFGKAEARVLEKILRLGRDAVPALLGALEECPTDGWPALQRKRCKAVLALGSSGDPTVLPVLLHELRCGETSTAAAALASFGDRAAIPALLKIIGVGTIRAVSIRNDTAAGKAIAQLAEHVDVPALRTALRLLPPLPQTSGDAPDPRTEARQEARRELMTALGRFGDPLVVRALLGCRDSSVPLVSLLVQIGAPAIPELISALESPAGLDAGAALQALMALGTPAVAPLRRAFMHAKPGVRHLIAIPLACLGDPDESLIPPLVDGLSYPDLAEMAALALSRAAETSPGPALRSALPALERLDHWTNPLTMREACREAIRRIEAGTAAVQCIPLPAEAPDALPRPAAAVEPARSQLPIAS